MKSSTSPTKLLDSEEKSMHRHYELLKHHDNEKSCDLLKHYLPSTNDKDTCCICSEQVSFNPHNPFTSSCDSCGIVHERCCLTMNIADIDNDAIAKCPLCKCIIIRSNDSNITAYTWLSNHKNSLCPFCLVPTLSI